MWADAANVRLWEVFEVSLNRTAAWFFTPKLIGIFDLDLTDQFVL
jgi:hypothetical protein